MSTTLFSFRMDTALKAKLDALAEATKRSKSFLAMEALERYVDVQSWHIAHIKRAMVESDEGAYVDGADVDKWLQSWGTDAELPPPKVRRKARR